MFSNGGSGFSDKQFLTDLKRYQARMQAYPEQLVRLEQLCQKKWYTNTDLLSVLQAVPDETTFDYQLKLKFLNLIMVLNAFNDLLETSPKLPFKLHYYQFIRECIELASHLARDEKVDQLGNKIEGLITVITQVTALIRAPDDTQIFTRLTTATQQLENFVNPPLYHDYLDNPRWRRFAGVMGLVVSAALLIVAAVIHPIFSGLVLGGLFVTALALACTSATMLCMQHHPCDETDDDDELETISASLPISKVNEALHQLTLFSKDALNEEPAEEKSVAAASVGLRASS